jgi:hypothetical protein
MLEDDQHVATAEDRSLAEGQPRPFPDEPSAKGEDGKPASAMLEDLEPPREAVKATEGPVTVDEPRAQGRQGQNPGKPE